MSGEVSDWAALRRVFFWIFISLIIANHTVRIVASRTTAPESTALPVWIGNLGGAIVHGFNDARLSAGGQIQTWAKVCPKKEYSYCERGIWYFRVVTGLN